LYPRESGRHRHLPVLRPVGRSDRLPQQAQTRNLGESDSGENQPRWGTARFDEQTALILRVTDSSQISARGHQQAGAR
jgi:hypothetical protein